VGDNLPTAFSSRNSVAIVRSLSVFAARSVTTVKFNIPHAPVCANLNRVNEIRPANSAGISDRPEVSRAASTAVPVSNRQRQVAKLVSEPATSC
jgi:hypothetical protein